MIAGKDPSKTGEDMRRTWAIGVAIASAVTLVTPVTADAAVRPLEFGVYPGGYAGNGSLDPAPDDPAKTERALDALQGRSRDFLVREYVGYSGSSTSGTDAAQYLPLLGHGRKLDLVLDKVQGPQYTGTLDGWLTYVRNEVRFAGPFAQDISLGGDANLNAATDPSLPTYVAQGVIAAKKEARRLGYWWLQIGFDEVPYRDPAVAFWTALTQAGGPELKKDLDYVGVELYPDVFVPAPADIPAQLESALDMVRTREMPIAGLGAGVPLRVSENGWDTVAPRTEAQQASTLDTEIRTLDADRGRFGIASYELFALRDDRTDTANLFDHFGLLRDDYTPKPAFDTYRGLVRSLR